MELCVVEPDPDSLTAWMSEGNCRLYPPAAFFPSDGVGVDRARKICKDCPVLASASTTRSKSGSSTACGVAAASVSVAAS